MTSGGRQLSRTVVMMALAVIVLVAGWWSPLSGAASETVRPTAGAMQIDPGMTAGAAIAVDLTSGVELYGLNADTPLPPASTMKIVTALVAKEILPLDQVVEINAADLLDPAEFSVMYLQAGDVVTVSELLYGLLMQSGGDAALALARASGYALDPSTTDPVGRFVAEMNAYAARIGMTNSRFSNPVGIDDPANMYSSPRDLVRATRVLLNDRLLANIVATVSATVEVDGPAARVVELRSSNQLLERGDVFGIKTGTEIVAGQCLITGFWRGDNQIITVVLGSADRYGDTLAIMEQVDATYRWLALGIDTVSQGASDAVAAQGLTFMTRRTVLMTVPQAEEITWELQPETDPRTTSEGVVVFRSGQREVARLPVYSSNSVTAPPG